MPHLTVYALEADLAGRETALAASLTDAVVAVYGEWARGLVSIRMLGIPPRRSFVGGHLQDVVPPAVTFGISDAAVARPDAETIVANLIAHVTDAVAAVFGDSVRAGITVDLVPGPPSLSGIGGTIVT
jgi:phenylpyruvate tautomerase PptA (4-oxalocrotonate tautomerase family)